MNNNYTFLFVGIAFFAIALIWVMLLSPDNGIFMYLTEKDSKLNLIKLIGWGISGIIAFFGVLGLLQRAAALDEQNKLTEKGHIHERFKAATEHLGNKDSVSVRIAAFYEFYRLADIEPDLSETISDILCAHLRQTTRDEKYQNGHAPTEEMGSLVNILLKQETKK